MDKSLETLKSFEEWKIGKMKKISKEVAKKKACCNLSIICCN
jgi:hypothetical protein